MSHTVQPSRHVRRKCRSAYHLKRIETQNVFTFTENQRSRKSTARKRSTRQKAYSRALELKGKTSRREELLLYKSDGRILIEFVTVK